MSSARSFAIDVAAGVCGEHAVKDNVAPQHGRRGFLLHAGEGAGRHGVAGQWRRRDAVSLHNSRYDFNDMAIPFGVSFFVRTVERFLDPKQA